MLSSAALLSCPASTGAIIALHDLIKEYVAVGTGDGRVGDGHGSSVPAVSICVSPTVGERAANGPVGTHATSSPHQGIRREHLFVGVGSDEAIDLLLRMACVPGKDSIIICPPTYGMYTVSAKTNDVGIVEVPLTSSFELQPDKILDKVTAATKLIFVCTPNNPTVCFCCCCYRSCARSLYWYSVWAQ